MPELFVFNKQVLMRAKLWQSIWRNVRVIYCHVVVQSVYCGIHVNISQQFSILLIPHYFLHVWVASFANFYIIYWVEIYSGL